MAEENEESMNTSFNNLSLSLETEKFVEEQLMSFIGNSNEQSAETENASYIDIGSSQSQKKNCSTGSIPSNKEEKSDKIQGDRKNRNNSNNKLADMPNMKVILKDRMVRLRYESELGNRNIGKDELISIKFEHMTSDVVLRIHTIHKDNKKAHPYLLMGRHCCEGVYMQNFKPSAENNYTCVIKATIKIPLKNQYEDSLRKKKTTMEDKMGLHIADMKKGDYWSTNKGMRECQSLRLCVEAYYSDANGQAFLLHEITEPMSNAKVGKTFKIHTIRPCAAPCVGVPVNNVNDYMLIVLTADSFDPKQVSVKFQDSEGWTVEATNITIIKNVIECEIPPYKAQDLHHPVNVKVSLEDTSKDMSSMNAADFQYTPCEDVVRDGKMRKLNDATFDNIPIHVVEESEKDKKSFPDKYHGRSSNSRKRERPSQRIKSTNRTSATFTAPSTFSDVSNDSNKDPVKFNMTPTFNFQGLIQPSAPIVNPQGSEAIDFLSEEGMKLEVGYDPLLDIITTGHPNRMTSTASNSASFQPSHQAPPMNLNPVTQQPLPAVQSPTSNPNRGKFKTVNCEQTGQTFILDQNNKVILVIGGNSGTEATEIPEYTISSPGALSSIPPATDNLGMVSSTMTSRNQVIANGSNIDLPVTMMQPHYESQNGYQQTFTTVSQGQTNMNFNQTESGFEFSRLISSDLQMDGAESLGLTEVTVTTSKEIVSDLGKNIMVGDDEDTVNDLSAKVSKFDENLKKENDRNVDEKEQLEDLDEVMNSFNSMDLKENQASKQASQSTSN